MSEQPQEPFKESNLESPEYRERLMRKLNTLIAVLEVANAKVDRSINAPAADLDRLAKIRDQPLEHARGLPPRSPCPAAPRGAPRGPAREPRRGRPDRR